MSKLCQQRIVDMKEPGVFTRPGFSSKAGLIIIIPITRILRTVHVHFECTLIVPVTAAAVAQSPGYILLPGGKMLLRPFCCAAILCEFDSCRPRARGAGAARPCARGAARPRPLEGSWQLPLFTAWTISCRSEPPF